MDNITQHPSCSNHTPSTNGTYRGSFKELATLILMVREHPLCPPLLQDNINDAIMAATRATDFFKTPEGIEQFLIAHKVIQNSEPSPAGYEAA
jgi:hypothetical protein